MRALFLGVLLLSLVCLSLVCLTTVTPAQAKRRKHHHHHHHLPPAPAKPNVLFLMMDDLRIDIAPQNPNQVIPTPTLSKLASGSVVFTNMYSAYPVCGPSRASMLTGRRPDVTRAYTFFTTLRQFAPSTFTLPQLFRNRGWYTAAIGKVNHYINSTNTQPAPPSLGGPLDEVFSWNFTALAPMGDGGRDCGSELWCSCGNVGEPPCQDELIANLSISKLRERAATATTTPFFIAVGMRRPHTAYVYPDWFRAKLHLDQIRAPLPKMRLPREPIFSTRSMPALAFYSCTNLQTFTAVSNETMLPWDPMEDSVLRRIRLEYWASTAWADFQIGRVLDELDRLALSESTLVVFTADHGYQRGFPFLWARRLR